MVVIMLKLLFFSTLIGSMTIRQVSTEKIDFKKIFHTPKDYDKLEILERSSFEPDDPVETDKLPGKHYSQPKAFANAQVLLNFDNEETAEANGRNDAKRSKCPYAPYHPMHPFPMFHPAPYPYPYHPHHGGCYWIPPCFTHPPPQEYFHKRPQDLIDIRMNKPLENNNNVPERPGYGNDNPSFSKVTESTKGKSNEEKIEDCLNREFKILTSKEPVECVGCSPSLINGKFPTDVDSLMMNQSSDGFKETPSTCPSCGGGQNVGKCPTCAKYTKELNDMFNS